ncbi:MAG: YfiR family protein [Ignavibacteria bacterium]|nr:YfiR family protein [Ignavibacteria bacterium]
MGFLTMLRQDSFIKIKGNTLLIEGKYTMLRRSLLLLAMVVMLNCIPDYPYARPEAPSEYKFKAVYLFNFLKFVEWPNDAFQRADSPIVIGIFGNDPFEHWLDETVSEETINGRKVIIRRYDSIRDARNCHMLFIPRSQQNHITEILALLDTLSVLTVSEVEGITGRGVGINFYVQENKLRFEINSEAIKKADLKIDSRLLRLAKIVTPTGD